MVMLAGVYQSGGGSPRAGPGAASLGALLCALWVLGVAAAGTQCSNPCPSEEEALPVLCGARGPRASCWACGYVDGPAVTAAAEWGCQMRLTF